MSQGRVWKYGDNVNTDVIFPGRYTYQIMEPAEMARHAMEDLDPEFAGKVKPGDVIVAGLNFGCGSSQGAGGGVSAGGGRPGRHRQVLRQDLLSGTPSTSGWRSSSALRPRTRY